MDIVSEHDRFRPRPVPDDRHAPHHLQRDLHQLCLDDNDASVYLYALRKGCISAPVDVAAELGLAVRTVDEVIDRLGQLRLLRREPAVGAAYRLVPVNPEVAAASLISPVAAEIHYRHEMIADIRAQMSALLPRYQEVRQHSESAPSIRALRDYAEVRGSLYLAAAGCHSEVLSVRSRDNGWGAPPDEALPRDLSTLARGVRMRLLYQHTARADLPTRAYIRRVVAAGANVRTTDQLPRPFVVFDHEAAFMAMSGAAEPAFGALDIKNKVVIQFLSDIFECIWSSALPYTAAETGYQGVVDEIQKTIANLLADGFTDEVIARRLDMSLRTCRRHIAALLSNLNSVSRFQAGVQAAKGGLIDGT